MVPSVGWIPFFWQQAAFSGPAPRSGSNISAKEDSHYRVARAPRQVIYARDKHMIQDKYTLEHVGEGFTFIVVLTAIHEKPFILLSI